MAAIFLVEDEVLIRMMIADMATDLGHRIAAEIGDVKGALKHADETSFDVAILDVQLLDGSSEPIADLLTARNIPFAFASGYGSGGLPERFKDRPILRSRSKPPSFKGASKSCCRVRRLTSSGNQEEKHAN